MSGDQTTIAEALLTEEELEALKDDFEEDGGNTDEALNGEIVDDEPSQAALDAQAEADAALAAKLKAKEAPVEEKPAEEAPKDDPAPAAEEEPKPAPYSDSPRAIAPKGDVDAARATMDGFDDALKAIDADYDDGETTPEQRDEARKALMSEYTEATKLVGQAEAYSTHEATSWRDAVHAHVAEYPELGKNSAFTEAWDIEVNAVSRMPSMQGKGYSEILKLAHARVERSQDEYGIEAFPTLKGKATPAPKKDPALPKSADNLGSVPKTVAALPAAGAGAEGEGPHAKLLALIESGDDPLLVEKLMSQMPEDERNELANYAT